MADLNVSFMKWLASLPGVKPLTQEAEEDTKSNGVEPSCINISQEVDDEPVLLIEGNGNNLKGNHPFSAETLQAATPNNGFNFDLGKKFVGKDSPSGTVAKNDETPTDSEPVQTGSIKDLSVYKTYYSMYQEYCASKNTDLTFEGWLLSEGYYSNFIQQVENYLETQDAGLDDSTKDTLNIQKHLTNDTGSVYQAEDGTCYEFDWETGTYKILKNKEDIAKALGISNIENIDTINIGYCKAEVVDYTFGNLEDGQDSEIRSVQGGNYANITYRSQEFDIHYILDVLLQNPNDPQYKIALGVFDELCANIDQWCSATDIAELDKIAEQYGTNSIEYKNALKDIILRNLDQAQEWVDNHTHVAYSDNATVGGTVGSDGTGGIDGVGGVGGAGGTDGADGVDGTTPLEDIPGTYDKRDAIDDSPYGSAYQGATTNTLTDYGKATDTYSTAKANFDSQAKQILSSVAESLMNQLRAELGAAFDEAAIREMCKDAIQATIDAFINVPESYDKYQKKGKFNTQATNQKKKKWFVHDGGTTKGVYTCPNEIGLLFLGKKGSGGGNGQEGRWAFNTKALIDCFFAKFDELCKNGGKTDAEVKAETEAAEKEKEAQETGYKELYKMDYSKMTQSLGLSDTYTADSLDMAKATVENTILDPMISEMKAKLKDKGIPDADLNILLSDAKRYTLNSYQDWATSDTVTITINTSKVVSIFEEKIEEAIKNKGYNF